MARTIYTERDIEDLARRGEKELALTEDIYLTDLARERAEKLGVSLRLVSPSATSKASLPGATNVHLESTEELVGKIKTNTQAS